MAEPQTSEAESRVRSYMQISQEEAKRRMEAEDGHVIVDVRRQDEYDEGHIPGAVCIPNGTISDAKPMELRDLDQIILVYCRTGRRSKEAAQKLSDIGYTRVYEFGGILDWTGEIVTAEKDEAPGTAQITLESFDGGGPEFTVLIDNEELVSYESRIKYADSYDANLDGNGYTVTFVFTGSKPGETGMRIEERSPIADNLDRIYRVRVDDELNVQIEEVSVRNIEEEPEEMRLAIRGTEVPVVWEENESVEGLRSLCPLTVQLSMYGGFEQVGGLGQSLPRDDFQITTGCGDVVLYAGNQIVLFYGSNTWAYTPLGHIDLSQEELTELLGNGDVEITIE